MSDPYHHDIDVGEPPVLLQKRKSFGALGLLSGLVFLAGACSLLWVNYDRLVEASSAKPAAAPVAATAPAEDQVSLADFQALQKQTADSLQSAAQLANAQQAELKRLADQVAALTAKIDQIQPQAQGNAAAPRAADPARPAAAPIAPRKRPAAPRPAGAISLGGAPLPGTLTPPGR